MPATQTEQIRQHLRENGSITPVEALNQYGVMRLAARVYDLKEEGMEIKKRLTAPSSSSNRSTKFATYYLPGHE